MGDLMAPFLAFGVFIVVGFAQRFFLAGCLLICCDCLVIWWLC
jgi:hypothetical protein